MGCLPRYRDGIRKHVPGGAERAAAASEIELHGRREPPGWVGEDRLPLAARSRFCPSQGWDRQLDLVTGLDRDRLRARVTASADRVELEAELRRASDDVGGDREGLGG